MFRPAPEYRGGRAGTTVAFRGIPDSLAMLASTQKPKTAFPVFSDADSIMRRRLLTILFLLSSATAFLAAPAGAVQPPAVNTAANRPIRALLITGGCCHDYERQKRILTRGLSARANIQWTIVHQGGTTTDTKIPFYNNPNWAEGFDVVVHNECFAGVVDKDFVDGILKAHQQGVPAILIHCAMHCYRVGDDRWFEFCGVQSPGHGPHYAYTIDNLKPEHPIMEGFGERFVVPKGELYHTVRIFDSATPLAHARRMDNNEPQVCVWTNDYRGTRVFGTTVGHYNETMVEPVWLDMVARGLLWATGRDPNQHFAPATPQQDEAIRSLVSAPIEGSAPVLTQGCCGDGNLVFNKPAKASSEETGKKNFAANAVDGRLDTRWCAAGPNSGESLVLDMETPQSLRNVRIHWEQRNTAYRYRLEASANNVDWQLLADHADNKDRNGLAVDAVKADGVRYLKITFLGSGGGWGSIWEVEAVPGDLPALPEGVTSGAPAATVEDVKTPPDFDVTLFAAPPQVTYPVCLTTSVHGEVFVGVDEQGSLGKDPGRGRVVRCVDTDGDGRADQFNDFAKMDHPRGLVYDNGSLWVLHPPLLSVFRDTNGDGTADESEVLIEGISTDEVNRRGADHTTNGIRMGIDGWIYIAVGDFGFHKAVGRDGTVLSRRGGGVVRVRPDGTELEVFSWGQRNIVDIAVDPFLNVFTRDNTNDGGGWDIRLSHVLPTANYGYPSQYINFTDEIMPPLADYGGGSGCGALYFQDARWPAPWQDMLLTCDWGRSEVFSHRLPAHGATFDAQQDSFLQIPRPTDADADAFGRLFVSSWKNGGFAFERPDVGFVAMITPRGFIPRPPLVPAELSDAALVQQLAHPADALRLHVQREILRRPALSPDLLRTAALDSKLPLTGRVAALWTLRQKDTAAFRNAFVALMMHPELQEHVLRAAADRRGQIDKSLLGPIYARLDDANPRVRAAAIVAIARAGDARAAKQLLNLTQRTEAAPAGDGDAWRKADPGRVLPHLAMQALVDLRAIDPCLQALDGPHRAAALAVLRRIHDPRSVDGLFAKLATTYNDSDRTDLWTALIRLYHREGDFTPDSPGWWGTRPDTTGPVYHRQTWSESERIAAAVKVALQESSPQSRETLLALLKKHGVNLEGTGTTTVMAETQQAIKVPQADPGNPNLIANLDYETVLQRTLAVNNADPARGAELFRQQSCINCHTFANGQQPRGPHLVDIGKRYKPAELVESIVQPGRRIAQGFDTWAMAMQDGKIHTGFVVLESAETVTLRDATGLAKDLIREQIEDRVKQEISMMPQGIVGNLTPEQLADLLAWLGTLH